MNGDTKMDIENTKEDEDDESEKIYVSYWIENKSPIDNQKFEDYDSVLLKDNIGELWVRITCGIDEMFEGRIIDKIIGRAYGKSDIVNFELKHIHDFKKADQSRICRLTMSG